MLIPWLALLGEFPWSLHMVLEPTHAHDNEGHHEPIMVFRKIVNPSRELGGVKGKFCNDPIPIKSVHGYICWSSEPNCHLLG